MLTDSDWLMLATREAYSRQPAQRELRAQVVQALREHYHLAAVGQHFGQGSGSVHVYLRR